jgi:hypothetical protein
MLVPITHSEEETDVAHDMTLNDTETLTELNRQFIEAFRQGSWDLLEPILSPGFSDPVAVELASRPLCVARRSLHQKRISVAARRPPPRAGRKPYPSLLPSIRPWESVIGCWELASAVLARLGAVADRRRCHRERVREPGAGDA